MITYKYKFRFQDGTEKEFSVDLAPNSLALNGDQSRSYPDWVALENCKCPHCPLEGYKYCPVAAGLSDLVDYFRGFISYKEAYVSIETGERKYTKQTTLQQGLSSLIGIYMVSSDCPYMEKLRPMVRYHLPFATSDETKYRALSMYLMAQFFIMRRGGAPDWDMRSLVKIYEDIHLVNRYIAKRLSGVGMEDANINAIHILDCFANSVAFSLSEDMLDEMEAIFAPYLKEARLEPTK